MDKYLFALLLIIGLTTTAAAGTQPEVIFTQEVVAFNPDGSRLPSVKIEPESIPGMRRYDFDLGKNRTLRIQTNIKQPEKRGLNKVVATVERCYRHIEDKSGKQLERGAMLYLIELDEIPSAYTFRSSHDNASQWSEVRLILVERGAHLSGPGAPGNISELLYNTLPHELGHAVLSGISQLQHDIDGKKSNHTRWFIEGICEVLAKGFSLQEVPELYRNLLQRKISSELSDEQTLSTLLRWAQSNDNEMMLESDLYGAAMLTMMVWIEMVPVKELLVRLEAHSEPVDGEALINIMRETTGIGPQEMIRRAHSRSKSLGISPRSA